MYLIRAKTKVLNSSTSGKNVKGNLSVAKSNKKLIKPELEQLLILAEQLELTYNFSLVLNLKERRIIEKRIIKILENLNYKVSKDLEKAIIKS